MRSIAYLPAGPRNCLFRLSSLVFLVRTQLGGITGIASGIAKNLQFVGAWDESANRVDQDVDALVPHERADVADPERLPRAVARSSEQRRKRRATGSRTTVGSVTT